jgi:hypothetical protein
MSAVDQYFLCAILAILITASAVWVGRNTG